MIKLSEPFFFGNELKYLINCLKDKWISSGGKFSKAFEQKMKKYSNGKFNLGIINCTSALQLAIKLLNPKEKDEIILPSISFIATSNAVIYNNCNPVFMDCDSQLLLNKKKFYSFINKNTYFKNGFTYNKKSKKRIISIIIVNTFGNLFNFDSRFLSFCKKKNIKIIEDSAESLGSKYKNKKKIKNISFSCYSFNGNKLVTAGGGGLISTNSKNEYLRAIYLSSQAKNNSTYFVHNEVGYNFRISNLHASIALSQIENLSKVLLKKKKIHSLYKKRLNNISGLEILSNPEYCTSNNWLNILIVNKKKYGLSKEKIIQNFFKKKIETRSLWYPLHLQKPFKDFETYGITNSKKMYENCLCLPSSYGLKLGDQEKIIKYLENKFK